MKEKRNLHLKVQEICDCYATTDPLKEMSEIDQETDREAAAAKWLALAALHGVNNNAKKISISKTDDGGVKVVAEYRKSDLPVPGVETADAILEAVRAITHIETDKGKTPLSLGIRDSSVDLGVKLKRKEGREKVSIKFPEE